MKIKYLFIVLIIFSLFISGCGETEEVVKNGGDSEENKNMEIEGGLLTEKLSFQDESFSGQVIKNKITKTAEIKMEMFIPDDVETQELFGEEVSSVPFTVNTMCGLFGVAFFNPTVLGGLTESGNMTAESGENFLEGYSVTKATIDFIDEEDKKLIADCTSTGEEWENIKFNSYRQYENSLFGAVIGKTFEETEKEKAEESLSNEVTHLSVNCLGSQNWDADAEDDGIVIGVAPLSIDNTIVAVEGFVVLKAYVLEKDEGTWGYYEGDLVNTRTTSPLEGEERFKYFDSFSGYRINFYWDNTEPYPADKEDYGVIYATFTTKDGKTFEAKYGDDWKLCQIRES